MSERAGSFDTEVLLLALQHGDSFFPSGGLAFSWGLETLWVDKHLSCAADVEAFLRVQLEARWASCDRVALHVAYRHAIGEAALQQVDRDIEALTWSRELRDGSRRAGAALLGAHRRLGRPAALALDEAMRGGIHIGHLAVVQGVLWRSLGLPESAASTLSAHVLCVSVLGAAIRLGALGHIDSQEILARLHPDIASLVARAPPAEIASFAPATEVAAMRHESMRSRLFVN